MKLSFNFSLSNSEIYEVKKISEVLKSVIAHKKLWERIQIEVCLNESLKRSYVYKKGEYSYKISMKRFSLELLQTLLIKICKRCYKSFWGESRYFTFRENTAKWPYVTF